MPVANATLLLTRPGAVTTFFEISEYKPGYTYAATSSTLGALYGTASIAFFTGHNFSASVK